MALAEGGIGLSRGIGRGVGVTGLRGAGEGRGLGSATDRSRPPSSRSRRSSHGLGAESSEKEMGEVS
jgi:hypothetical protein